MDSQDAVNQKLEAIIEANTTRLKASVGFGSSLGSTTEGTFGTTMFELRYYIFQV